MAHARPPAAVPRHRGLQLAAALVALAGVARGQFANPGAYTSQVPASQTTGRNLLFFGNSFTISSTNAAVNTPAWGGARGVPELVRQVAIAAGHPAPFVKNVYHLNRGLDYHVLASNPSLAAIDEPLLEGESWDVVVLQGFSLRPTDHPFTGNLAKLLTNGLVMAQEVLAGSTNHQLQSPAATLVLYQTWARRPGHWLYDTGSTSTAGSNLPYATELWSAGPIFRDLPELAAQVRTGYAALERHLRAALPGTEVRIGRAGDAWERLVASGSGPDPWGGDAYHAASPGDLLTALTLYGTIYGDAATRAHVQSGALDGVLAALGIARGDALLLADAADSVLTTPPPAGRPPQPRGRSILVDLSQAAGQPVGAETLPVPGRHYNVLADPVQGEVLDAVDVDGVRTGVDVRVLDAFADETSGGATGSWIGANALSGSLYAESAQLDGFFVGTGFGYADPAARLEVRGLDPARRYRFRFHGSRDSAGASRVGVYRVEDVLGTHTARLDALQNLNLSAVIAGLRPDASGRVLVEVMNDGGDPAFGYLNVLEIEPMGPSALLAPSRPRPSDG